MQISEAGRKSLLHFTQSAKEKGGLLGQKQASKEGSVPIGSASPSIGGGSGGSTQKMIADVLDQIKSVQESSMEKNAKQQMLDLLQMRLQQLRDQLAQEREEKNAEALGITASGKPSGTTLLDQLRRELEGEEVSGGLDKYV